MVQPSVVGNGEFIRSTVFKLPELRLDSHVFERPFPFHGVVFPLFLPRIRVDGLFHRERYLASLLLDLAYLLGNLFEFFNILLKGDLCAIVEVHDALVVSTLCLVLTAPSWHTGHPVEGQGGLIRSYAQVDGLEPLLILLPLLFRHGLAQSEQAVVAPAARECHRGRLQSCPFQHLAGMG